MKNENKIRSENYVICSLRKEETELLKDFLYEAIFIPKGAEPPERDIIEKPELRVYMGDFGARKGDNCLVADFGGKVVGAVWTRIIACLGIPYAKSEAFRGAYHCAELPLFFGTIRDIPDIPKEFLEINLRQSVVLQKAKSKGYKNE